MPGANDLKIQDCNGVEHVQLSPNKETCESSLICLHGLFGGLSNYEQLLNHLRGHNIYVPSIPVYDFDGQITIHKLTEWLHSFCERLGITKPILLGNSMGGHLALDYALHYPAATKALVLTGSSGLMENKLGTSFPRRHDREYLHQQANKVFYDDMVSEDLLNHIEGIISNTSKLENILRIARDTHEYNMEKHLPKITQQVLLIWGRNDKVTPPSVACRFLQKLPNAQLCWIDECGHAPMMEHPRKFAKMLHSFLNHLQSKNNSETYEKDSSHR